MNDKLCPVCLGDGVNPGYSERTETKCADCHGTGYINNESNIRKCIYCDGELTFVRVNPKNKKEEQYCCKKCSSMNYLYEEKLK